MADGVTPNVQEDARSQFGAQFDMAPGLDGKTWPRMHIMSGLTAYVICVPLEVFEQFIQGITEGGRQTIAAVKTANSPIKVARPSDIPRHNGQRKDGQFRR